MPNPEDRLSYQRVREDNFDNYHNDHHHNYPQEISDTDYPASRFQSHKPITICNYKFIFSIDSDEDHGGNSATLPFR